MKLGYLTFDDGPTGGTDAVLEVLRLCNVRATFFLTGKNLADNPSLQRALIQKMIDGGHALGNHGYDHDPASPEGYRASTPQAVQPDFVRNSVHFDQLFQSAGRVFPGFSCARLPGDGRFQRAFVRMITTQVELAHVGWTFEFAPTEQGGLRHIRNQKWQGLEGIRATSEGFPGAGAILLGHDGHWRNRGALLRSLVEKLATEFQFQTLEKVPRHPSIAPAHP